MIQVNQILRGANQKIIEFKNDDWLLEIEIDEYLKKMELMGTKAMIRKQTKFTFKNGQVTLMLILQP